MLKRFLALSIAITALMCLDSCAVISKHIYPSEVRYPGYDNINGAILKSGEHIQFDRQPPQHTARAIGDTLYAFVDNEFTKIPMGEVVLLDVDRVFPRLDLVGTAQVVTQAGKFIFELARVAAPVAIPAIFVLIVWGSFK